MRHDSLDKTNKRLIDYYGKTGDKPNWRVVWSEDQYENRYGDYEDRTPEGILIRRVSEVRWVPKYKQWVHEKWCLETLMEVPFINSSELPSTKLSYELIYAFPYNNDKPLFPSWGVLRFLIEEINRNIEVKTGPKYKDPLSDLKIVPEMQEQELNKIQEELFGNETDVGDALAYREGVGYSTSKVFSGKERDS